MKRKLLIPWIIIIVALFVFWPIGAYLIYRKVTNDKLELLKNSGSLNKAGLIFIVVGFILFVIFSLSSNPTLKSFAKGGIFITSGGVVMIYFGVTINRLAKRYRNYIQIIINDGITNLTQIAKEIHLSPIKVDRDLQSMIELGYFGESYIDYVNDLVVIKENQQDQTPDHPGQITVICRNCGARNQLDPDSGGQCHYCGSPISNKPK